MIVNTHTEGWEIISHYTHGLVAGKIAEQLQASLKSDFWVDVLTAIIVHDDRLLHFDEKEYLTKAGAPQNFTADINLTDALKHAKRLYEDATQKSQLIALLISKHLHFLYWDRSDQHQELHAFLEFLKTQRTKQRKYYNLTKKEVMAMYDLLLFCDRCSLILCGNKIPAIGRDLEINKTIDNETHYISELDANTLTIRPWRFEADRFSITYETRIVNQLQFKTTKEFKKQLNSAEIVMKEYYFQKE